MTKSLDELYAPKAMSLDELFAAIRPPPLLPVSYPPSDNSDFMSRSSAAGVNMPRPILPDRLLAEEQPPQHTSFGASQTPLAPVAANMPSAPPNSVVPRSYSDDVTNQQLQTLHPGVRQDFADFLDDVNNQLGIRLRAYKGFRSNADQATEYAKGRTTPGPPTTGARPGESYHQ